MACPGSANLELSIPGWQEPEVDETKGQKGLGTRFHFAMAEVAELTTPGQMMKMAECFQALADLRASRRFKMLIEQEMVAEWLPSKPKTTPDLVFYTQDELHVWDWKWGTIPVEVVDNKQLMFYCRTAAPLAPKAKQVTVHVGQPLANGHTEWTMTAAELAQFTIDAIAADTAILADDTTLSPSDNCTFCPANPHSRGDKGRPFCPKMMDHLGYGLKVDIDEILDL